MPSLQLSRPNLRKLALILELHDIDAKDNATYNREAAWIKRTAHRFRTKASTTTPARAGQQQQASRHAHLK